MKTVPESLNMDEIVRRLSSRIYQAVYRVSIGLTLADSGVSKEDLSAINVEEILGKIKDFQHFQDMFDQNISNLKQNVELNKPLEMEVEDLSLKACLYYRNGCSFMQICYKLGLGREPQSAKRLVIKGLDILLKEQNITKVVAV